METIAFATLLFVVYFCSICCFLYNPKASATAEASTSVPVVGAAKSTVTPIAPVAPEPTTQEVAVALAPQQPSQNVCSEPVIAAVEEPARVEDALSQILLGIDLDKLQLRPARKIAGSLNIQQKVNGKDQSLGFLRAQIKKRLNEQPQEVAPVIEEVLRAS